MIRRVLFWLLVSCFPFAADAGISKVQSTTASGTSPALSGVVAKDFLTLTLQYILNAGASATPTVVDSTGQNWNVDNCPTPQGSSGAGWVGTAIFSLPNANSGTHTITVTLAGSLVIANSMAEWSGMPITSALDQGGATGGNTFGTTTMTVNAAGPTSQAGELVIAVMAVETNSGASAAISDPPSGFTASLALNNTWQGSGFGYEVAYQIRSSIGTPSASWSWTGSGSTLHAATLATYRGYVSTAMFFGSP